MRVVIIGGVAGGMSAAARLRRLDAKAEIIVLERSGNVSYANCGLPYFVGGVIQNEEALVLQTPESLFKRFRLDVRVNTEVTAIDRKAKSVKVRDNLASKEFDLTYDKLIYSPGAAPIRPNIPGIERALSLRTVEDVFAMSDSVKQSPKSTVIIGGGFIGLELAENFNHKGIKTSVIEATEQVMAPLDAEMVSFVHAEIRKQGVDLYLGSGVTEIKEKTVKLANGEEIAADVVVSAIGVKPENNLAVAAGIEVGPKGGVKVNDFNQTNDPDIYAVGDVTEKEDYLDGSSTLVPLANIANRYGRVIADHICGKKVRKVPAQTTAIVKVFDLTVATTGWNEKKLKAAGRDYLVVHTHPASHAGYYPGAQGMSIKLLVDKKSQKILGAQAVGREGVDKRIDVIATAIHGGITAPELADLELAYAPPYGSAKDPVNMLGYISENVLTGATPTVQWSEVNELVSKGWKVVDVRSKGEFDRGHIPNSINISIDEMRERINEVPKEKLLVTCQVGQRGHAATRLLRELGYEAVNLDGGYMTWSNSPAGIK
jgi:NADPH-dependent 2,4-dienoyl-CoA reductase/sulfur reductase-like enzyme/rhodanese-related sulfurtransferase